MSKKNRRQDIPARLFLVAMLVILITTLSLVIWIRTEPQEDRNAAVTPPPAEPTYSAPAAEPNCIMVLDVPASIPEPEALPLRLPVSRYASVQMTSAERQELASILFLEAANQCAEGQQAVVEVVLNRVISADFPDNVHDVLYQGAGSAVPQFSTIGNIALAAPGQAQQDAIDAALYGPSILPADVVYFSREGENDRVWGTIEDHVFCYGYIWDYRCNAACAAKRRQYGRDAARAGGARTGA